VKAVHLKSSDFILYKDSVTIKVSEIYSALVKNQIDKTVATDGRQPNHSHAWRGTWDRPMKMDENRLHAFTIARMTNHKVRASDG
jgi:hypothetical protein